MKAEAHKTSKWSATRFAIALVATGLSALALAPSASALLTRPEIATFGSDGTAATNFGASSGDATPNQLAFNQANDKLYVLAQAAAKIYAFNAPAHAPAGGAFPLAVATPGDEPDIAVDNTAGASANNIYFVSENSNQIFGFNSAGAALGGGFPISLGGSADICGAAVDPSGNLWVGDYNAKAIRKYDSLGNSLGTVSTASQGKPCHLAFDSNGDMFVAMYFGAVWKYTAASGYGTATQVNLPASAFTHAISVDTTAHTLYVAYSDSGSSVSKVSAFSTGGTFLYDFAIANGGLVNYRGLAVDQSTDQVYLSDAAGAGKVRVYGPAQEPPQATTGSATITGFGSTTVNGTVNAHGEALEECLFEFGTDTAYGQIAECEDPDAGEIGSGNDSVAVHADLSSLAPETTYHYRLLVKNPNGTVAGSDRSFKTPAKPAILGAWSRDVGFTEAKIEASISPENAATTYRFEWGPDSTYGNSTSEIDLGSGATAHTVNLQLEGLQPGASYHYRVVATNPLSPPGGVIGEDHSFITYRPVTHRPCPNDAFRPGPGAALPDCRAYEMVSPVDKNGGDVSAAITAGQGTSGYRQAAVGGDRITYTAATAFGDAQRGAYANQYMATRSPAGWSSHGLNPAQGTTVFDVAGTAIPPRIHLDFGNGFQAFTPDLCAALFVDQNQDPLTADAIHGYTDAYVRDNCGADADTYKAITTGAPPSSSGEGVDLWLEARNYSRDLSHVIFTSRGALTGDAAPGAANHNQIYARSGGELHLVSVLPQGAGPSTENNAIGTGRPEREATLAHAVSDDGSRVFWTVNSSTGLSETVSGPLYLRKNAGEEQSALDGGGNCTEPDRACTVELSSGPAIFWTANLAGSTAIYSVGGDLFEFDVESDASAEIAGQVGGVVGASEDLSYLYFTSQEVLDAGAQAGEWNLYLRHDGTVSFIATIASEDRVLKGGVIDTRRANFHSSRVSPDGRHLTFMSIARLSGYDNTDALSGKADREVYVYDADSAQLSCVSCNPGGARPLGRDIGSHNGLEVDEVWAAAWIPNWEKSNYAKRSLSNDGSRVFFNALDALLPEDVNSAQDVYEWEAPGSGSCDTGDADYFPQNDGCLSLVSTGRGTADSEFVDASADGRDLFIETNSSIDPRDPGLIDLYDAREEGGFPPPGQASPPCLGDACQSVPAAPNDQTPASSSFQGAGNVTQGTLSGCRKGKVRRKGHCVRKHARRHHRRATNRNRRAVR